MRSPLLSVLLLSACPATEFVPSAQSDGGRVASPPCLTTFPERVDFGEIDSFTSAFTNVRVTNVSRTSINLRVTPLAAPFGVGLLGSEIIDPGDSTHLNVSFEPVGGLLHLSQLELGTGACSVSLPLRGLGRGSVQVSTSFLEFGGVDPGQTRTLELQFSNSSRKAESADLSLSEEQGPDGPIFSLDADTLEFPPTSETTVRVSATPRSFARYFGNLAVRGARVSLDVRMEVSAGAPVARFSPEAFEVPLMGFSAGSVPPSFVARTVTLRNEGNDAGVFGSGVRLMPPFLRATRDDGGFVNADEVQINVPMEMEGVLPGKSAALKLRVSPPSLGLHRYRITIFTNDPLRPEQLITFSGEAVTLPSCSLQVPLSVRFTSTGDGGSSGTVRFANAGALDCVLDGLRLVDSNHRYEVISGVTDQRVLVPGEAHEVVVRGPQGASNPSAAIEFHVLGPDSNERTVLLLPSH